LTDVRQSLRLANKEITGTSLANVLTALASADQRIQEIHVVLPFTSNARNADGFLGSFLPDLPKGECRDLTGVQVHLWTHEDQFVRFDYAPSDLVVEHQYNDSDGARADSIEKEKVG
jgi:hypothetical protein